MATRRGWRALCAAIAVAALVAGCSSTSDDGGGRGDTGGKALGDDKAGITDTEIHIGAIVGNKQFADAAVGIKARIKEVNDAGGINGRKIVVDDYKDDGYSPVSAATAVRALVQQDKVFALIPISSFLANAKQFIDQQGVPTFGFGFDDTWCDSDYTFAYTGCPAGTTKRTSNLAYFAGQLFPDKTVKGHTFAVIGDDGASATRTAQLYGSVIKSQGGNVVLTQHSIPGGNAAPVSDFTPYANEVMRSNNGKAPDYVMTITTAQNTIGMAVALGKAGFRGIRQEFTLYDPRLAPVAAGGIQLLSMQPYEADTARTKAMIASIHAIKPDQQLTLPLGFGYWSAEMFVKALEKAGKDLTRSALVKALNDGFDVTDTEGLGRLQFPRMHTESAGCLSAVSSDGKKFTVVSKLTCTDLIPNPLA